MLLLDMTVNCFNWWLFLCLNWPNLFILLSHHSGRRASEHTRSDVFFHDVAVVAPSLSRASCCCSCGARLSPSSATYKPLLPVSVVVSVFHHSLPSSPLFFFFFFVLPSFLGCLDLAPPPPPLDSVSVFMGPGTIRKAQNLLKQYSQHGLDGKKGGSNLTPLEGNAPRSSLRCLSLPPRWQFTGVSHVVLPCCFSFRATGTLISSWQSQQLQDYSDDV